MMQLKGNYVPGMLQHRHSVPIILGRTRRPGSGDKILFHAASTMEEEAKILLRELQM